MTTIDTSPALPRTLLHLSTLERQYYLALLSMAAIDLLLSSIFLFLSGKPELIALRLPEILGFLVGLTLVGGRMLFAPIRHFIETGQDERAARERAARLGSMTAIWTMTVAMLFTVWSFLIAPFVLYDVPLTREVGFILIGRALTWVVLLPYVAIFTMQEYLRGLRRALFNQYGIVVPPGKARLGRKLALIFLGGAVAPGVSIAITLTLVPEFSPITGQPRSVVVVTTLAGAVLALGLGFWAMQRATTRTLTTVLDGMRRAQAGDLGTAIAIETDDELGHFAHGFNALTRSLAEARFDARRKEAERAHAAGQFHEAQKHEALGNLAAGIAHDFNNILGVVTMYTAMTQKRCAEDDVTRERLDSVLTAAGQGRDLIAQILDFVREQPGDHETFDLAEKIRETAAMLRDTLARDVTLDLDPIDGPIMVTGDATRLHQVLTNLAINAVQAMPPHTGRLRITLDRLTVAGERADGMRMRLGDDAMTLAIYEDGLDGVSHSLLGILKAGPHARLTVDDNGSGMTAETLRSIFNPYFTTKPVGEGTGLGLAAVAGIVEAHGGAIHVRTKDGDGTRFDIFLPCIEEG